MTCYLCEENPAETYFGYWCKKCRRIRHLINLYGLEKVGEVLDRVLVRDDQRQEHKVRDCIKEVVEEKKYNLRNKSVAETKRQE